MSYQASAIWSGFLSPLVLLAPLVDIGILEGGSGEMQPLSYSEGRCQVFQSRGAAAHTHSFSEGKRDRPESACSHLS
ncbi:hypothetical protein TNCV_5011991 [Trichonephila clavipes]|nr:hypothetical protein TNCV_5011991 [Trichonephila clavipes]